MSDAAELCSCTGYEPWTKRDMPLSCAFILRRISNPAPSLRKEEISADAWQLAALLSRATSLFTKELSNQELYPDFPLVTHSIVP